MWLDKRSTTKYDAHCTRHKYTYDVDIGNSVEETRRWELAEILGPGQVRRERWNLEDYPTLTTPLPYGLVSRVMDSGTNAASGIRSQDIGDFSGVGVSYAFVSKVMDRAYPAGYGNVFVWYENYPLAHNLLQDFDVTNGFTFR